MTYLKLLPYLFVLLILVLIQVCCTTDEPDPKPVIEPVQTLEECIAEKVDTLQSGRAYMALQENRAKWQCQDINNYSFIVTQAIGISLCRQIEFKIVVKDSVITSTEVVNDATASQNCIESLVTIDGLFDFINVAVDETIPTGYRDPMDRDLDLFVAFGVIIDYDEVYGFPTSIFIDYVRQLADEEFSVQVRDFEVL